MTSAPDQLRLIRDQTVRLERLLDGRGAQGSGLLTKARSVNPPLAGNVLEDLKIVAHLRNQVMHEGRDLTPAQLTRFQAAATRAEQALSAPAPASGAPRLPPSRPAAVSERQLPGHFYDAPVKNPAPLPEPKGCGWVLARMARVALAVPFVLAGMWLSHLTQDADMLTQAIIPGIPFVIALVLIFGP